MKESIHQGDNLWFDIPGTITDIDATWPGTWSGSWQIVSSMSDADIAAPLATGQLYPWDGVQLPANVPGKFRLSVPKAATAAITIPTGSITRDVFLVVKITNDPTGYSEIIHQDRLTVIKAGI